MALVLINICNSPSRHPSTFSAKALFRYRATAYGGRGGGPNWDSNAEKTVRAERFRFNFDDEDANQYGPRGGANKRVWWSDEASDGEEVVEDDEDDDDRGFGVFEDSIDMGWIFKVMNAFGWMIPAIAISMLVGTGPNTLLMAIALPLAQSAVSLVTETIWGRSSSSRKPKQRPKRKKTYARAATYTQTREETDENIKTDKVRDDYQSWETENGSSTRTSEKRASNSFGGWDELNNETGSYKAPKGEPSQKPNETRRMKKSKLSRMRSRERPLLLRLLIAMFPFFGSWTKLL